MDKIYERVLRLASHRHAPIYLGGISFTEAVIFPVPPDLLLIPMVLADKSKAWRYALLTTVGSVLGGLVGYLIGVFLFDTIGRVVIEFYGLGSYFDSMAEWYENYGIWIVLVSGFTPIPYKVFTIASGVFAMAILPFLLFSLIGRALRFFIVAAICLWMSDSVYKIMKRVSGPAMLVICTLVVIGFVFWTVS